MADNLPVDGGHHGEEFGFLHRIGLDPAQFHNVVMSAAAGDPRDTARLFAWLRPEIVRYCTRRIRQTGLHYSIPDLVQDICLGALQALPRFHDSARPFLPYVFRIAANKICDRHRRYVRYDLTQPTADPPERPDHQPTPDDLTILRATTRHAIHLMATLTQTQQQVLALRIIHGLNTNETAQITGYSPEKVRVTQHRALNTLRTQLAAWSPGH